MRRFSTILLCFALVWSTQAITTATAGRLAGTTAIETAATKYYRTELYFGRSIAGGGVVSDEQWEQFLAEVVTPRFPNGFTGVKAIGQYRDKSGKIISEPSQILIFLYPKKDKRTCSVKIEEIRAAYVKRFDQESVLRMDMRTSVDVRF